MRTNTSRDDIAIIGVDPGPQPGVFADRYSPPQKDGSKIRTTMPIYFECNPDALLLFIQAILPSDVRLVIITYELYVVGNRSAKVSTPGDNATTMRMCGQIQGLAGHDPRIAIKRHTAAQVMPWASVDRLERAGIAKLVAKLTHARSAAKHCLFTAVHDAGVPDPLSKRHKMAEVPA